MGLRVGEALAGLSGAHGVGVGAAAGHDHAARACGEARQHGAQARPVREEASADLDDSPHAASCACGFNARTASATRSGSMPLVRSKPRHRPPRKPR